MNTQTTEMPISDPKHPLHRPAATATAIPAKAAEAQTAVVPAPTPKAKKAAGKAKATKAAKAKDADAPKNPRSIVPVRFKEAYAKTNDTCGSKLALALKQATTAENKDGRECLDVDALKAIAKANNVDFSKYEKLNNGQKRMNVGNKLAGLVKNGTTVTIGKQKFASEKALVHAHAA